MMMENLGNILMAAGFRLVAAAIFMSMSASRKHEDGTLDYFD